MISNDPAPAFEPGGRAPAWLDLFERQAPPAEEDLVWAQSVNPEQASPEQRQRLAAIAAALFASRQGLPATTAGELEWLLQLAAKGPEPPAPGSAPSDRMWDIWARFLLEQQALLQQLARQLQAEPAPEPPTQQELDWARALHQAALAGQAPSESDYRRYLAILAGCRAFGREPGL